MKTRIDRLMGYAPPEDYGEMPLSSDQIERISDLTMKKLPNQKTKHRRPLRTALTATAAAAILCGSAFAAYEMDWFGLQNIFGADAEPAEGYAVHYDSSADIDVTQPSYTEEEQSMIADGTMTVPDQAALSDTGVSASTGDFTYTLETMLVSEDSLWAVVRAEANTDEAAKAMTQDDLDTEQAMLARAEVEENGNAYTSTEAVADLDNFQLQAMDNTGEGHEKELKNGGMSMTLLQAEGKTGYFLVTNSGGQFAVGDRILFHEMVHNVDLFEVPVTTLYEGETTISLDQSVYEGKGYTLEQLTITPLSLAIDGHYTVSSDQSWPEVSITLKDGTSFDLASIQNGYADTAYGTYGSLSSAGTSGGSADDPFIRDTWMFSKALDLEQIDHITVDGVDYTLE
jgi:hypothetical protein